MYFIQQGLPILSIHPINDLNSNCYVCYQMIHKLFWVSLIIYGDLYYYYNVIYQPSLFSHINSRYHAFKSEVLKDRHCKTAQFWTRYMDIIQMVLTLITATLNCMSALSECLVPNVHCRRSQQLRTICACVTDYTHQFVWYTSQMQITYRTKWVYCATIIDSWLE